MHDAIIALKSIHNVLARSHAKRLQLPEPGLTLDLDSRRDSELRTFRHLHQMCAIHGETYRQGNGIKLAYLIDAYVGMVERLNPLGTYAAARGLLEFNAFVHEVRTKLKSKMDRARTEWHAAGREFFGVVVQARYGTSNPAYQELLKREGLSSSRLRPFHILDCIKGLALEVGFEDVGSRYDVLCDFVHHNLSSQIAAKAGGFVGNRGVSEGGGEFTTPDEGLIVQFQYPIPAKAERALEHTADGALIDAEASLRWLNETPTTPYDEDELLRRTGSRLGFPLQESSFTTTRQVKKIGRNEPCPCGSGKKFKVCCGAASH